MAVLLRHISIKYYAKDELTLGELNSKMLDCLTEETVRKIANDYCPQGVEVVVRQEGAG